MPFVRSFHGERVALLALTQRALAARHPLDLPQQQRQQERPEDDNDEGSDGNPNRLVSPKPQRGLRIARHRKPQLRIPHRSDRNEVLAAVDRIEYPIARGGGRQHECGKPAAHDIRHVRNADEERAVIAQ